MEILCEGQYLSIICEKIKIDRQSYAFTFNIDLKRNTQKHTKQELLRFKLDNDFKFNEIKMTFSINLKRNNQKHAKQLLIRFELDNGFNYQ